MGDDDVGHLAGHRHQVVGHAAIEQLAAAVVEAFLVERAADALHDRAAHLLVDQHRVDDAAAVFHRPMLEQFDEAGLDVDLDIGCLHAIGEDEGVVALGVMARHHQLGREARWQGVGPEVGDAAEFGQRHQLGLARSVDHRIAVQRQLGRRPAQDRRGHQQDVLAQRLAGLQHRFAADAGAARGPGAAAIRRDIGVAGDDADLVHRHADRVGGDLRKDCFIALALLADADQHSDAAGRLEAGGRAVLCCNACTADAVESCTRIGQLDQCGEADAAIDTAQTQRGLFGQQRGVVDQRFDLVQALLVRELFQPDA